MKKLVRHLFAWALVLSQFLSFSVFAETSDFKGETVKVGVASDYEKEVWEVVADLAAEDEVTVEIVLFNDYIQPNIALSDGSIDLNAFQHVIFLREWNEANDGEIIPLGFTYAAPMKVYSDSLTSIDEIEEKAKIGIPNDPTNGGRALLVLEEAGLIEVDDEAGVLPTLRDITKNDLELEIIELEAAQIPHSLADFDAAVINNNFANDAGLTDDQVLFSDGDDMASLRVEYKDIIAAHQDDVDNPLYKYIVELYQTEPIADKLVELSDGSDVPAWSEDDTYPIELETSDEE